MNSNFGFQNQNQNRLYVFIFILLGLLVITGSLFATISNSPTINPNKAPESQLGSTSTTNEIVPVNDKIKSNFNDNHLKTLVRQTARWALAAQQDKNPIIGLLHANYAAGYLWALRDIATDTEIERTTGVNLSELTKKITEIQDSATIVVAEKLKLDDDTYLANLSRSHNLTNF